MELAPGVTSAHSWLLIYGPSPCGNENTDHPSLIHLRLAICVGATSSGNLSASPLPPARLFRYPGIGNHSDASVWPRRWRTLIKIFSLESPGSGDGNSPARS